MVSTSENSTSESIIFLSYEVTNMQCTANLNCIISFQQSAFTIFYYLLFSVICSQNTNTDCYFNFFWLNGIWGDILREKTSTVYYRKICLPPLAKYKEVLELQTPEHSKIHISFQVKSGRWCHRGAINSAPKSFSEPSPEQMLGEYINKASQRETCKHILLKM